MSTIVPKHRPGVTRLADLSAEEQAHHAQNDATTALLKIKRQGERMDTMEQNLQVLANVVAKLATKLNVVI